jgi:hypothetical protein
MWVELKGGRWGQRKVGRVLTRRCRTFSVVLNFQDPGGYMPSL